MKERIEEKIERLEELLQTWHAENELKNRQSFEKIKKLLISACCILVGAVGAIWSFIELSDWYLQQKAISDMANNYIAIANENYSRTRDVQMAMNMAAKAVELTPNDPDVRFYYVYYRSQKVYQDLLQISRPLTGEEISSVNETFSELGVLKKLAPERWEPYMLEATLQRRLKKYEKAEAAIKTASSLEKNFNPELHYWHYMIAYSLKKYDEAAAIVDELMEKAPEDKWALLAAARYCSNHQKQYEKALELCSKAIEKDPDFYEAYLLESALYSYMKDRKASIAAGKKAIELRPTACAAAYHNIAIQMRLLGNLSTALAYAEKGIELFPGLIELRLRKIQILIDMGLYDNLTGEIAQLMKMAPENANPYQYEVDIDIAQGNFAEARRAAWKFYEFLNLRESDSAAAYNNLAWRFYLLGTDLQTARECSGKSLKGRVPAGRYDTLCHILSALGDKKSFDEAAAKLLSICANDAEKVRYNCFLSTMLLRMNVPAEAWQKIEIAGKIDPERLEVCKAKAEYFIYMKEFAKAEKCIEAALGKTSAVREIAEINYLRARLHAAKGEFQSAVEYMEAVEERMNTGFLEIQPFFFSYAEYLIKCGRYREARRKLEKIRPICNDMARYNRLIQQINAAAPGN